MNICFHDVQTPKSSVNCNKYSKSVSYETLVDGTATIGTDIKQTQCLSKCCAVKPFSAVGTFSALKNASKVVEKFLQKPFIFRLVKILMVVVFLLTENVSESRATEIPAEGVRGTCNSAGTCLWTLDESGKMTISALDNNKVEMDNYSCDGYLTCSGNRPWEQYIKQIKNVVIGDNITKIGDDAFQNAINLQNVSGMKDVKIIGNNGVFAYTNVSDFSIPEGVSYIGSDPVTGTNVSKIVIPDGVTSMGNQAFKELYELTEIVIPDSWADEANLYLDNGMFKNSCFSKNPLENCQKDKLLITCKGDTDNCKKALAKFGTKGGCSLNGNCLDMNKVEIISATKEQCTGSNYYWSGVGCSRKNLDGRVNCAEGFVEWDNDCLDEYPFAKKRWTPAEASKWLHDGNDNFVVITFKK